MGAYPATGRSRDEAAGLKENIRTKLRSIKVPSGGAFTKFSETIEELKKDLPGVETPAQAAKPAAEAPKTPVLPQNTAPAVAPHRRKWQTRPR